MKNQFQCSQCGLCCRNIGNVPALHEYHDGNGVCKFLDKAANLCRIYERRPIICNVAAAYDEYFSEYYSEDKYLRMNYVACKKLQQIFNKEDILKVPKCKNDQ